jgi:hypothetical protein
MYFEPLQAGQGEGALHLGQGNPPRPQQAPHFFSIFPSCWQTGQPTALEPPQKGQVIFPLEQILQVSFSPVSQVIFPCPPQPGQSHRPPPSQTGQVNFLRPLHRRQMIL